MFKPNAKAHAFVAMLKNRPDEMMVTDAYIAVYHSGLDQAVIIPGDFRNVTSEQANATLQLNLKKLNETF